MNAGRYSAQTPLTAFIPGITHEIWEERGVDLIRRYYAPDIAIVTQGGPISGVEAVIANTHETLAAFPDRLLVPEDVLWSQDAPTRAYSSHRIMSPMTNLGPTIWGPATGRSVAVRTVADCVVEDGRITGEWLVRDQWSLLEQLGFDPLKAAQSAASRRSEDERGWYSEACKRLRSASDVDHEMTATVSALLAALLLPGDGDALDSLVAHYAVRHESPHRVLSGAPAVIAAYAPFREAFADTVLRVEHIAAQTWAGEGLDLAVRFSMAGRHRGRFCGIPATDREAYVLGIAHWRMTAGQLAVDWTVFDRLGIAAQLL